MHEADLYVALLLLGILPTIVWRLLGVWLSGGISDSSEIFAWVRAVATATLAGVVAKLTFMPSGALESVSMPVRASGLIVGLAAYALFRRSVVAGVVSGVGAVMLGAWLKL